MQKDSLSIRLFSGSVLRWMHILSSVIISFYMMPFLVHNLGDKYYGFWSLVGTFVGYYGFFDLGLSSAVSRFASQALGKGDKNEVNNVFATSFFIFVIIGAFFLLFTLAVALLAPHYFKTQDGILFSKAILFMGISTALGFPIRSFIGLLYAQLRHDLFVISEFLALLLKSVLVFWLVSGGGKVIAVAGASFIAVLFNYALVVIFFLKCFPEIKIKASYFQKILVPKLFSYSFFSFVSQLANLLRFQVDAFIITSFLGVSLVTTYSISSSLMTYFLQFMMSIMGMLSPLFSRYEGANESHKIYQNFRSSIKISSFLSCSAIFAIILFGKEFIELWMGAQYLTAYPVLVIIGSALGFALIQEPAIALMYGLSKHKYVALIYTCEGLLKVLLSILLIKKLGLIGVAIGTALPMVINMLFAVPLYTSRILKISPIEYYFKILFPQILKTVPVFLVALLVKEISHYQITSYASLFLFGSIFMGIHFIVLFFIGFEVNEKKIFSQLANKIFRFKKKSN